MTWQYILSQNVELHPYLYRYEYMLRMDNPQLKTFCFSADADKTIYRQPKGKLNRGCLSDCGVRHSENTILLYKPHTKPCRKIPDETLFVSPKSDVIHLYNISVQSYGPIFLEFFAWAFATMYHKYKLQPFHPNYPNPFVSLLLLIPIAHPIPVL